MEYSYARLQTYETIINEMSANTLNDYYKSLKLNDSKHTEESLRQLSMKWKPTNFALIEQLYPKWRPKTVRTNTTETSKNKLFRLALTNLTEMAANKQRTQSDNTN